MKRFSLLIAGALVASAFLVVGPAVAAVDHNPVLTFQAPVAHALQAPAPELAVCSLIVVEDETSCQFGVMVAEDCPPEMAATIDAVSGPRLFASDAFLAACPGRHDPPPE